MRYRNRKNLIIILSLVAFIGIVGGISFSYFVYNKNLGDVSIDTGEISINYSDVNGNMSLIGIVPKSDNEGKISSSYVDFTVDGVVDTDKIYYELYLLPKSGNTINSNYVKVYLTDQENTVIKDVTLYNDLRVNENEDGKIIYRATIDPNVNGAKKTYSKDFRLRVWLDESYSESTTKTFEFDINLYAKNVNNDYEVPPPLATLIGSKASTANYIASYADIIQTNPTFGTQDTVGTNANKETVYYYTGSDAAANANVLFAGYCWQIIRTTDTGGVKLIYNGVAENNKCETTRSVTKGINGATGTNISLSGATLFGRSYDYDLATGQFTIEDSTGLPTAWSENDANSNGKKDYEELIGTYTCNSSSSTCTTLYYVGSYESNTNAYIESYTIGNVSHYSQMGRSAFNASSYSPALVGYMFNKEYDYNQGSKVGEYYTNAVWENGAYTLSVGNSGTEPDSTHHYICDSDCTSVRYYYLVGGNYHYYILLENGKTVEDALKEMINYKVNASDADENINLYNSSMKGYLDNWYKKNLTEYASYLDINAVFCNDRSIRDLGGWNPNGTKINGTLNFYQYGANRDLKCVNETDRFSIGNNKAKLEYPIGLLIEPERNLMTSSFAVTGQKYWMLSLFYYNGVSDFVRFVDTSGTSDSTQVFYAHGVRGVVTLKPGIEFDSGTGTYTDPYVVGPLVQR